MMDGRQFSQRRSQRFTTGEAGGLSALIRALLLAPLGGEGLIQERSDHFVADSVYPFTLTASVTGHMKAVGRLYFGGIPLVIKPARFIFRLLNT